MKTIIIILGIVSIIFIIKNYSLLKEMSFSKKYRQIYNSVLQKDENIDSKLSDYIEHESSGYFSNKAKILFLFNKLQKNEDVSSLIDQIDFNSIFFMNGKYSADHINLNSDMFIWLLAMLPRLKNVGMIDSVYAKLSSLNEKINDHLEYRTFKSVYAFLNNDDENAKFLDELLNGEYSDLIYDKQMIGVIKRIALAYVASTSQDKKIEYQDELAIFASTYIGTCLMTDLNIYEVYRNNENK